MKINLQTVLRRKLHHCGVPIHHVLVVAVHEVDLHARNPPALIHPKRFVQRPHFQRPVHIA
jgi:hypothetical protein